VPIHLTMDLVPEVTVVVHREGELPVDEKQAEEEPAVEVPADNTAVAEEVETVVEEAAEFVEDEEAATDEA